MCPYADVREIEIQRHSFGRVDRFVCRCATLGCDCRRTRVYDSGSRRSILHRVFGRRWGNKESNIGEKEGDRYCPEVMQCTVSHINLAETL